MAARAGLRRAVPTRPRMQVLDVQLEEPGKEEDLPTVRADTGQVDEGQRVAGNRAASTQFLYGLQAKTSPLRAHPTVSMSNGPGIT